MESLRDTKNFLYFTTLLQQKVNGGVVAQSPPPGFMESLGSLVDKRIAFDCPGCGAYLLYPEGATSVDCDCGRHIDVGKIRTQNRFMLKDEIRLSFT